MSIFKPYDIRGTVPDQIDEDVAENLGKAFATYADSNTVVVGRDNREHGEKLSDAFIRGCTATGADVIDLGIAPNPVVTWFGREKEAASCVITASHNPPQWNGFKFRAANGSFISEETGLHTIQEIYEAERFTTDSPGTVEEHDPFPQYLETVLDTVTVTESPRLVVNPGNGAVAVLAEELFTRLGCDVIPLNTATENGFPDYMPNPQNPAMRKETREAVKEHDADLGVMFDMDGDRTGFIASDGSVIDGDAAYTFLARHVLQKEKGRCLYEVKHSQIVPDTIEKHGGTPFLHRTGNSFIVNTLFDNPDIVFAGELSGHYFFPCYDRPFDDAPFTAALFTAAYTADDNPLHTLEQLRSRYNTSDEYRIPVENVSTVDGLRIQTDHGWILIRPSNTEPKLTVRFETGNEEDFARFEDLVTALQPRSEE